MVHIASWTADKHAYIPVNTQIHQLSPIHNYHKNIDYIDGYNTYVFCLLFGNHCYVGRLCPLVSMMYVELKRG